MSGEHTVALSADEFAAWSERGRAAARFRVGIKRAARQAARDLGLAACVVVGPDGAILERCDLLDMRAFAGRGCGIHADAPYPSCADCQ